MPTLAEQIANDYQFMDGIEDVELRDERVDPAVSKPAAKALRRAMSLKTASVIQGGGLPETMTTFHVWVSTLDGAQLDRGWVLVQAGGKRWSVINASLETLSTRYRLTCIAEV